jgi:LysR family nitrogen assimilation transcriptional regulator
MELRELRTFVSVADLGTVSKAAEHLHITQPALSRQIAGLEGELGLKLFDRVGRRLLLTSEGAQLLVECRGLLNYSRAVRERADGLKRGDAGCFASRRHRTSWRACSRASCMFTASGTRMSKSGWSKP